MTEHTHNVQYTRLTLQFGELKNKFEIMENKRKTTLKKMVTKLTTLNTADSADIVRVKVNKTESEVGRMTNPIWTGKDTIIKYNSTLYKRSKSDNHATSLVTNVKCKHNYKLLVLINTHASHSNRRQTIRKTWGTDPVNHRWKTYFLIGKTLNHQNLQMLENEIKTYNDLIISDV